MKNFNYLSLIVLLAALCGTLSCVEPKVQNLAQHSIIPEPLEVQTAEGVFIINQETKLYFQGDSLDLEIAFIKKIYRSTFGKELEKISEAKGNSIQIVLDNKLDIPEEGYELVVNNNMMLLNSSSRSGIFYGIQTIRQLLPPSSEDDALDFISSYKIANGVIKDAPAYSYRGLMLDVARHFFEVDEVKLLIDRMSKYKFNHLHLHLSDDQGWRIEIKSWPLLTTIGGSTQVGGGKGGYYTQDDYKSIVQYAQERHITIVPEIDMPGHTNSALAAYGILNPGITVPEAGSVLVDKKELGIEEDLNATPLYTGIEVGFSTLDYNKNITYQFVDDVVREISALTPGPYFHIGGDESLVVPMEDYIRFMEKVQDIAKKYNKISIGWDEISHSKMLAGNIAQFWAMKENAKMALDQGNKILFSPATKIYLDMQYDSLTKIGLHWAAYIEVDEAYNWDPLELINGIERSSILGVEGPLWTETITNRSEMEYMLFPRITAIAEIGWSEKEKRSWENYSRKVKHHYLWWDKMNINYYKSPKIQ